MPNDFAKAIGAGFRDKDKIVSAVTRHLAKRNVIDDYAIRGIGAIHPSEAAKSNWCPRSTYYRITGATENVVPVSLAMEMVYETGNDSGNKFQRWFREMGILRGLWRCMWCELHWIDISPKICPRCEHGEDLIEYKEVPFENKEYLLRGSADGDILHGDRWRLIENKTVGVGTIRVEAFSIYRKHSISVTENGHTRDVVDVPELWKAIRRPFASHLKQGMIYCFCAERDDITFIYDPKFVTSFPKEFEVKFDKELIEDVLTKCIVVRDSLQVQRAPKRPIELEPTSEVCKRCVYRKTCWGDRTK